MTMKLDNKILISGIIVGLALAFVGAVMLWNSIKDVSAANRADLTSCTSSSTYYRLAANTVTRIAATSTSRMRSKG